LGENRLASLGRRRVGRQDRQNVLLLSVVSIWEMQIKPQLGKLRLALSLQEIVETQQQTNSIETLPVTPAHVLALENLPAHHKDPFDRLLVAQATVEEAVLVSGDPPILPSMGFKLFIGGDEHLSPTARTL
jgi:PIN domain nuclease of toxin-antitoxin system